MVGDKGSSSKRRRNRVPISCYNCRTLKTKCDGVRPVCSTCSYSRRRCVFSQQGVSATTKVMVDENYLRGLEKRLEELQNANSTAGPGRTAAAVAPHGLDSYQDRRTSASVCPAPSPAALSPETTSSSVVVDANVSIGGVSFTQLLLNSLLGDGNVEAQPIMANSEVRAKQSLLTHEDLYTVPDNAAEVLDQYFTCRNILTPLFHAPSARPIFDAALRCPSKERHHYRPTFVLLNMIFALCTSHWLVDVDSNPRAARRYYDIAMALLQPTLLRDWTLEHVQSLLLGARYLQCTSCGDECWNVLGLAIRIAYGLRLHQDPPKTDPPPLRETKRRVWYAAYTLEMHWSMVYQRPPAIRSSDFFVCLPEDLDDDCIQRDRVLYPMPRGPSFMSFFIETLKLYRIVEKVLTQLSEKKITSQETAEVVMTLDEDYQKWFRERPAHLILDYNDAKEPPWILALRGNMVRILIHRQSLRVALHRLREPEQIETPMVNHVLQFSKKTCVAAAIESIDIVALRHAQTKKTMGLNFFNVYYLFNAVIVLVSYVVDPAHFHDRSALENVDKALHMIKSMSSNHCFAQWAYSFLQKLLAYMHQSLESQKQNSENATLPSSIPPAQTTTAWHTATTGGSEGLHDLHALFGFAQDLTVDLETQLGNYEPEGFSELWWTFDDGGTFNGF